MSERVCVELSADEYCMFRDRLGCIGDALEAANRLKRLELALLALDRLPGTLEVLSAREDDPVQAGRAQADIARALAFVDKETA